MYEKVEIYNFGIRIFYNVVSIKMKFPNISVIVPVYNGEKYVEECLKSLINQSMDSLEMIIVNDGSTDKSEEILRYYTQQYNNFIYLEQKNKGLSEARNSGLQYAHGEYIVFVDCDDILPQHALTYLYTTAKETHADIVVGNVMMFDNSNNMGYYVRKNKDSAFTTTGKMFLMQAIANQCFVPMVYNYMYHNMYIKRNNFRFESGILHEDELWTPIVLAMAKHVSYTNEITYLYRQHDSSIMSSSKKEMRIASIAHIIHKLKLFKMKYENDDIIEEAISNRIRLLNVIAKNLKNHLA